MMKIFMPFISVLASVLFASAASAAPAESVASTDAIHRGIVTYAKTAGGYSYLKIKKSDKEAWLATLPIEVAEGEEVEYTGGDVMSNFHSKAMNQTFDSIHFVTRIHVVSKHMPIDDVHKGVSATQSVAAPVNPSEIGEPRDGKTIQVIFAEKESLKGNKVLLRAKVVKFSKNILGKNWATLADGTGKSPNDKIIAVTRETLSVGDIVTAVGILKTNVNLGAGYQYEVILDNTKFTK